MTDSPLKLASVLVIDDDDISNFIYTRVISATGKVDHIESCKSGSEGLKYLERISSTPDKFPDMIFLDINMPVMSGWEFLEQYREIVPPHLQQETILCILSSSVYKTDVEKAQSFPQVKEYVPKPLTTDSLKSLLNKYFG